MTLTELIDDVFDRELTLVVADDALDARTSELLGSFFGSQGVAVTSDPADEAVLLAQERSPGAFTGLWSFDESLTETVRAHVASVA